MAIDRVKVRKEAEKFVQSGKLDRAIDCYRQLLDDNPRDAQALVLMNTIGDLSVQAGRMGEALDIFKRLAMAYERDGFAPKATAILKKAVRHAPDDMDLAQRLAEMYKQTGMIKDAVSVHLQVAEHFTKKGLIKRALEEFTKVVELDPKNLKMKIRLADLYNKEGMKDRAATIYLEVAETLAIEQMPGEAAQIVERAKAMVTTPQVFLTQSRLCVIQKDLSGAALHLREGLQANPRSTELLEALAEIEIQTRNPDRALEALAEVVQLPEKCLGLCDRALRDLVKMGRTDEGLRIFKPIGRDLARRGMGDSVARTLKSAMGGQFTVEAWVQLAEIAHQSGNKHDQGQALQQAYGLAQQQRDQNLIATLVQQLQALGLTPSDAPAPPPAPSLPSPSAAPRMGTSEFTLPGAELTELDPVKRMQIQQLEREADNHLRTRSFDRAVEALKRILELDAANLGAIEKIADVHRQSGMLSKVQMHYVNSAQALAQAGKKRLAVGLLDKAEALMPGSTRLYRRQLGLTPEDLAKETTPLGSPAIPLAPPPTPAIALGAPVAPELPVIPLALPEPEAPAIPLELVDLAPVGEAPLPPDPFAALPVADLPGFGEPETLVLPPGAVPPLPAPAEALAVPDFDFGPLDLPAPPTEPGLPEAEIKAASLPTGEMPVFAAPPTPVAAGPVVDEELASLLSDIDFQLDYGSPDEAKVELENALKIHPGHPELLSRLERAEESLRKLGHEAKPAAAEDHSFFDLTDILGDALMDSGEGEEMHDATNVVEKVQSVDELFAAFREGVENQVRGDDYDTHYNLGIAYKEMMLMEPAMEEFKKAMDDPERTLECCSMLSICEMEQGNLDAAVQWLQQGIHAPGFPPEDSVGLRYDLGELFTQMGRAEEAKAEYHAVYEIDPEYREVAARIG